MPKQITITITKNNLIMITTIIIFSIIFFFYFFSKASFIEPTAGPASSDQDFAQNILGANNIDNDFDSSKVIASSSGSIIERLEYFTDYIQTKDRTEYVYGRGWVASSSGDSSVALTQKACEDAVDWEWFEDANGDGDMIDPEDGICVKTSTVTALAWNGMDYASWEDNTYLAGYTCTGSYPTGTVATYSGIDSSGVADTTWNAGDCALCEADCYDGRKDLPDQIGQDGSAYTGEAYGTTSHDGPLTSEILKNWKGTRLPTAEDYFGFCGATSGDIESTVGDGNYHASGASTDKTIGYSGQNIGREGEYMDLSNIGSGSLEWFSEQFMDLYARVNGYGNSACSTQHYKVVSSDYRFRSVFRP